MQSSKQNKSSAAKSQEHENTKMNTDQNTLDGNQDRDQEIVALQQALKSAQESERRALADYQNVVRRNAEQQAHFVKFATKEIVESLLEPLNHLDLAAKQLNDAGLNMVIDQFWQKLQDAGLQKKEVLGLPFDVDLMEAVKTEGAGEVVVAVHQPAYTLNGEVIQHARVVMGDKVTGDKN